MTSARLVVKDNKLINARYELSVAEMRLFLSMIARIGKDDKDFQTYRIHISDFVDALGTKAKNAYDRAKQTSKLLMEKVLEIEEDEDESEGSLQVSLLSSAKYYKGKGYVDLRFDPALKPYLLQLKKKFTAYDIRNILQLQSSHSIRIYELLKQYEHIGKRIFSVEELKKILGLSEQYSRYNDFKRYVLLQAEKELKAHCDIFFTFEEIKEGRRITEIRFVINRGTPLPQPTNDESKASDSTLENELKKMGLSHSQVEQVLSEKPAETVRTAIAYTQQRYRSTKGTSDEIRNLTAYLLRVLDSEVSIPEFVIENEQEEIAIQEERVERAKKLREEKQAEGMIDKLKDDFRSHRRRVYAQKAAQASEEEWQAFRNHIEENPYLKKKFIVDGKLVRNNEDIDFWIGSYLTEKDWPDTSENFMEWVFKEHGYQLEITGKMQDGKDKYQITGRQETLF